MNFIDSVFTKHNEILKEILVNISKYSTGDLIVTDEKFNILYSTLKNNKNKKITFYDVSENFMTENIKINIENFRNSKKRHLFLKLLFNDGKKMQNIPMDVHICKILSKKNKLMGYCIIIQDITQEIRNKIQKETFIDILSHDLKNPIRANIQILELILANKFGNLEPSLKSILDELLNSCRFMNYMTDSLLLKYKNEFNMYELRKEEYSIIKLIKEQCNKLMNLFDKKHQTIEFIADNNINEINIDVDEISKVVSSLLINASEQSCENSKIVVKAIKEKDKINVSFNDCGHKENKKKLNDIFEEYISCSNKFRKVGFSLELYNCRKIIEAHNGIISAQNLNNNGISIMFTLPIE